MRLLAALLRPLLLLGGFSCSRNLLALLATDLHIAPVLLACHFLLVTKHIILLVAQKKDSNQSPSRSRIPIRGWRDSLL